MGRLFGSAARAWHSQKTIGWLGAVASQHRFCLHHFHRIMGWNPMNFLHARCDEVSKECSNMAVVTLAGTSLRRSTQHATDGYIGVEQHFASHHVHYKFGCPKGGNSSLGFSILISKALHADVKVMQIWSPIGLLAGRCGAIRVCRGLFDFVHIGQYYPPRGFCFQQRCERMVDSMTKWLRKLRGALPPRTTFLLYMDLNDEVGLQLIDGAYQVAHSSDIGKCQRGHQHLAATSVG